MMKHSKFLSFILRHKPDSIGLTLDNEGWADISYIIANSELTMEMIIEIVNDNDKKRFEFDSDDNPTKIRARQGHSIDADVNLTRVDISPNEPLTLYHGTPAKNIESIAENGLLKMGRLHVHLTDNIETAEKTAKRYSDKIVVLKIRFEGSYSEPILYKSNNGVYLVENVPVEIIINIDEVK